MIEKSSVAFTQILLIQHSRDVGKVMSVENKSNPLEARDPIPELCLEILVSWICVRSTNTAVLILHYGGHCMAGRGLGSALLELARAGQRRGSTQVSYQETSEME